MTPSDEYAELSREQLIERLQELERVNGLYRFIIDAAPAMISYVDAMQHYRLVNRGYENWFNKDHKQLENRPVREVVGDTAFRGLAEHIRLALSGEQVNYEYQLENFQHGLRDISVSYIPHWVDEQVTGFCAMVQDITDRKRTEENLRQQLTLNQLYLDTVHSIILALDVDGRIVKLNRSACTLLGAEESELLGRDWFDNFITEPERDRVRAIFTRLLEGNDQEIEYNCNSIRCIDGSIRIVEWHNNRLVDDTLQPFGILSSGIDITERQRSETALQESEQRFRTLFEQAPIGMAIGRLDTRPIRVNQALQQFLGYSEEEMRKSDFLTWTHPDDLQASRAMLDKLLNGEAEELSIEKRYLRKDGRPVWAQTQVCVVHNDQGEADHFVAMIQDITRQKNKRQALAESEERYRNLFMGSPDAIFLNQNNRVTLVNQACLQLFGASSAEQLVGRPIYDLFHEDFHPIIRQRIDKILESDGIAPRLEEKIVRLDGSLVDVDVIAASFSYGDKKAIHVIMRDITQRKQAENALSESRRRLEWAEEIGHMGSWEFDLDNNRLTWSDEVFRIFGLDPQSFTPDYRYFLSAVHEDDRDMVDHSYRESVERDDASYDIEHRIIRSDTGETRIVHEKCLHFRNPEGRIVQSLGMVHDVTEQRHIKQALEAKNRELEAVLDIIPAMVYVKDSKLRHVNVNKATCDFTGAPKEQFIGYTCADVVPAELARSSEASDIEVLNSGQAIENIEESWTDANGKVHWATTSKAPILDEQGLVTGLVGLTINITERKEAELARIDNLKAQRDTLVREVHHRIKNHLQGVIGLLRNIITGDPSITTPLEEVITQIRTIAQVYGLQSTRDDARVRVCDLVLNSCKEVREPVQMSPRTPADREAILAQQEAVPVALIINELITNAIKHVNEESGQAQVAVNLNLANQEALLQISNSPARLPDDFDFATRRGTGTGLELVASLLPREGASLEIQQIDDAVITRLRLRSPVVSINPVE